jgi:hypothetical protein
MIDQGAESNLERKNLAICTSVLIIKSRTCCVTYGVRDLQLLVSDAKPIPEGEKLRIRRYNLGFP